MIKQQLKREDNIDARFVLISDTHITHIKEGYEPFDKTMSIVSELDADGYIFAGDMTYMHEKAGGGTVSKLYPKAYDLVNEVLDRYIPNAEKVFTIGNHEYPQNNFEDEISIAAIRLFEEKFEHKLNEHKIIKGYHFITVGGYSYLCSFSKETEEWAMKEIANALKDGDKPIFVVFHKPPHNTVVNSAKKSVHMSEEFRAFLNSHQRIINITGDLHTPAQEPKTIWQDGFTVVHCPLNAVGEIWHDICCANRNIPSDDMYSQSIVLDICDDVVIMHRIDIIADTVVGTPWTVDVNDKASWKYTNARFDVDIAPYFDDDTKINVSYKDSVLTAKVKDAVCDENDIEAFAAYYDVDITDACGREVFSERYASEYYLANRSGYFTISQEIELKGKYTISITPITAFYKKGNALKVEFDA